MKRNLIQIAMDQAALDSMLQDVEGELTAVLEGFLEEVQKNVVTKVDAYATALETIGDTAKRYRTRAEEYRQAAKAAENVVDRMKERIHTAMRIMSVQEISGDYVRFKIQNSPPKLVYGVLVADLPREYQLIEISADSAKIKAALEAGIQITGCSLERGQHIRKYLKGATK